MFTAVIAWVVFRENVDVQVFAGMVAIVIGGVLLSWQPGAAAVPAGALLIAAACACWATDNNLTRNVSTHDAVHQHLHRHSPITHTHAHYPDIHHRHRH